jgi:hypothetical protein
LLLLSITALTLIKYAKAPLSIDSARVAQQQSSRRQHRQFEQNFTSPLAE